MESQDLFDCCLTGCLNGSCMFLGIYININKISEFYLFDGCLTPKPGFSLV